MNGATFGHDYADWDRNGTVDPPPTNPFVPPVPPDPPWPADYQAFWDSMAVPCPCP